MRNLVAIVGNTGVGKSQLAVELAKHFDGEIINGDSMQMYQGLEIITNKHPLKEQEGIPHHLLGHIPWSQQYTVQQFEQEALATIDKIHEKNKLPILVGGTHYYIQSLIADNSLIGQRDSPSRSMTPEEERNLEDPTTVESELRRIDPIIAAKFHPNDTRRLRRCLEIYYTTGKIPSDIYATQEIDESHLRFRVLVFWIRADRTILTTRLDNRVDTMIKQGLMDEVEQMYKTWKTAQHPQSGVWQTIGFTQFLPYLQGDLDEPTTCVEAMKAETRQYAKKQTKWVVNKLIPYIQKIKGTFAALDSSDIDAWNINVKDRAIAILESWLTNKPVTVPLIPEHIDSVRKQQEYNQDQWVRHKCDVCSDVKRHEIVVMGDDAWKIHLSSKGHRRAADRIKNKAQREKWIKQT